MQAEQEQTEQVANMLGCDPSELEEPFALDMIVNSKQEVLPPQMIVIYGTPGIGKTTFASTFKKPILLRTEDGADAIDIDTFPKVATTLEEVRQALRTLYRGGHDYQTLVIDSLDWLEPLVFDEVCRQGGKENIEDFGYGKGFTYARDKWREIIMILESLKNKTGMSIVAIAHAVATTMDLPDLDPFQKYNMKLHRHGAALWTEKANMILFVNYKAHVVKKDNTNSVGKARGSGDRVIFTQERPAYLAKSRWPLDQEIFIGNDPTWEAFHNNFKEVTEGAYDNVTL